MAGLCEGGNEPAGSLKANNFRSNQEDRDITYALFCSVLCIMEQVLFDEILILSVEENPHVYDKRRASYNDEKMKENTWLSIAASLNTDRMLRGNKIVDIEPTFEDSSLREGIALLSMVVPTTLSLTPSKVPR
ncbi:hypothetical protein ANN_12141 [Periplaneta americana]|uniref:MADF domain-containing protein n=1 Tax=Periplaneta americana TaxID=6978 RepID=A0ABQ8T705_PERAM|nr:hypothetical protein ANN_12141 [Periplaneta americana]